MPKFFSQGIIAAALVGALAFALCACWVPERYIARMRIFPDGSYTVVMEGVAVDPDAAYAVRGQAGKQAAGAGHESSGGEGKKADDPLAPMLKELAGLRARGVVDEYKSLGGGRVRFSLSGKWRIDRSVLVYREVSQPLEYSVLADGSVRVRVKDAVQSRRADALGIKTDGDLSIVVDPRVQVLASNAQRKPSTPTGSYYWSIGPTMRQPPYLLLRFPPPGGARTDAAAAEAGKTSQPTTQKRLAHH